MSRGHLIRPPGHGPWGDASRHLPLAELERGLAALAPPKNAGRLALIVARGDEGRRATPDSAVVSTEGGLSGDAWSNDAPARIDVQLSLMRLDVARLIANGQPLSLFGDNLFIELDLSAANLPPGSLLRLGTAALEVTPEPHTGCAKFRQRFGDAALRLMANRRYRHLRLRGIYAKVVQSGEIEVGDSIEVVSRG